MYTTSDTLSIIARKSSSTVGVGGTKVDLTNVTETPCIDSLTYAVDVACTGLGYNVKGLV